MKGTDPSPMGEKRVGCMVLAGQHNRDGPFSDAFPVSNEALVPVAGMPLLTWVLAGLRESRHLDRIVVVGPDDLRDKAVAELPPRIQHRIEMVAPGESLTDNIRRGFEALEGHAWILISTADIPLITASIVDEFINKCFKAKGSFFYPVVARETIESRYPGVERTYVKVAGRVLTGGNIFLVERRIIPQALDVVEQFYRARKNPLRLASLLGLGYIVKWAAGSLTLEELESKVSSMVGAQGRVIISSHPEVGLDIDKPSHIPPVEEILRAGEPGSGGHQA